MTKSTTASEVVDRYKKRQQRMDKIPGLGGGILVRSQVTARYWFSPQGDVYPVSYEHGATALEIARELSLIPEDKAIQDLGYKTGWELARGVLFPKGWVRVQVAGKEVGLNAKRNALVSSTTEEAAFKIVPKPKSFAFEDWPNADNKGSATIEDYESMGWADMVSHAFRTGKYAREKKTSIRSKP